MKFQYQIRNVLVALPLLLAACTQPNNNGASTAVDDSRKVTIEKLRDQDGREIGEATKVNFSRSEVDAIRKQYADTALVSVGVSPSYNTMLFRIAGGPELNQVMIAPKVVAFGGRGQATVLHNDDGTVTLPFVVSLVDGIQKTIPDPTKEDVAYSLPSSFVVQDFAGLKREVNEKYNSNQTISSLSGCPEQIILNTGKHEYDVTPQSFRSSDYCEVNRPFQVSLKNITKQDAYEIMNTLLPRGMVNIYVRYSTQAPLTVGRLSIRFERSKFFESLRASLQLNGDQLLSRAEIDVAIQKIIQNNRFSVGIAGDYNQQMQMIVSKAIEAFFAPMAPSPSDMQQIEKCKETCFQLKYSRSEESQYFSVEWNQTSLTKINQTVLAYSNLKPADRKTAKIGRSVKLVGSTEDVFSNKQKTAYSSGLSGQRGDAVFFTPTAYTWENRVRASEEQIAESYDRTCTEYDVVKRCVKWYEIRGWTYAKEYSPAQMVVIEEPVGKVSQLFSQIGVQLRLNSGRTVSCPLSTLDTETDGVSAIFQLENSSACPIFANALEKVVDIAFINSISRGVVDYISGTRTVNNWYGNSESYQKASYEPEVQVTAEVSVGGGSFESANWMKK